MFALHVCLCLCLCFCIKGLLVVSHSVVYCDTRQCWMSLDSRTTKLNAKLRTSGTCVRVAGGETSVGACTVKLYVNNIFATIQACERVVNSRYARANTNT